MAIREIEVDTTALQRDINRINELIGKMKNKKAKLISSVQTMNASWSGSANAAFNAQFNTDMVNIDQMIQTLTDMSNSMKKARKEYDQCEKRVDGIIRSIRI